MDSGFIYALAAFMLSGFGFAGYGYYLLQRTRAAEEALQERENNGK